MSTVNIDMYVCVGQCRKVAESGGIRRVKSGMVLFSGEERRLLSSARVIALGFLFKKEQKKRKRTVTTTSFNCLCVAAKQHTLSDDYNNGRPHKCCVKATEMPSSLVRSLLFFSFL